MSEAEDVAQKAEQSTKAPPGQQSGRSGAEGAQPDGGQRAEQVEQDRDNEDRAANDNKVRRES